MISVLCPTRNRPDLLTKSIRSLLDTADHPEQVEVHLAVDDDDEATLAITLDLLRPGIDQIHVMQRLGYRRLHEYYNDMAKLAYGDWLLLWNDDAVMMSQGWDTYIHSQPEAVVETIKGICFPAVPKRWVDHLGHFALEWHNDAWWEQVGIMLGRRVKAKLEGTHHNPPDQTSDEARGQKKNPEFYGAENMALIKADVAKIKEIL